MNFEFSIYKPKKRAPRSIEPAVEIKPSGRIMFNTPARQLLESKPFCLMASDAANKAIGIMPLDQAEPNAFSVRTTAKGAYVGAKKFLKATGLLPSSVVKQAPVKAGEYIAIKL